MSKRIAFVSGKGGVGKSTIVSGLAVALSAIGKKVLIVDCDVCADAQKIFFGCEKESIFNLGDLMAERCDLCDAVTRVEGLNIDILTPPETFKDTEFRSFYKNLMKELEMVYDYILFDSPSGMDNGYELALCGCLSAIIVTDENPSSISFADKISFDLQTRKIPKCFIFNRLNPKKSRRKGINLDKIINKISTRLIGAVYTAEKIPLDTVQSMLKEETVFRCLVRIAERITGLYVKFGINKNY